MHENGSKLNESTWIANMAMVMRTAVTVNLTRADLRQMEDLKDTTLRVNPSPTLTVMTMVTELMRRKMKGRSHTRDLGAASHYVLSDERAVLVDEVTKTISSMMTRSARGNIRKMLVKSLMGQVKTRGVRDSEDRWSKWD